MSDLTLADVLRMPAFRRGGPIVLAAEDSLDRPIRWVHVTELADIAPLLRAGDLVLTTGTGLPSDDDEVALAGFVHGLAAAECAGLVVELGRRWADELPAPLVEACEQAGLPLVALTHETRFAQLTQAVGEQLVDARLAELRDAQRVHDTFTELSFTNAGREDVLNAVQRIADTPVVVENAQHRPVDFLPGSHGDEGFLENWSARSNRVRIAGRTGWDPGNGWLVARLGTHDETWGRLVIGAATRPPQRIIAVAERAAAALTLHRLHDRDQDSILRRQHRDIILRLRRAPDQAETIRRADLAGFPVQRRRFVAMIARSGPADGAPVDLRELTSALVAAAERETVAALVAEFDQDVVVLLSAAPSADLNRVVDRIAARVGEPRDILMAAGSVVTTSADVDLTLREARQVAAAVPRSAQTLGRGTAHRLADTRLRGLLSLLSDDERLRLFADRELAPLRRHDEREGDRPGGRLIPVLEALLRHPTSKRDAAASVHLSRTVFYDRIARIERLLEADLDDPDVRTSLHVALIAQEVAATH